MEWESNWYQDWASDPWMEVGSKKSSYRSGGGALFVSGETSRLYVRDPQKRRQWGNVEITVYAKRINDTGVPYSGIVTSARTNHGMSAPLESAPCDSRGISARLRFDGDADFGKETNHPTTVAADRVEAFPDGLPHDQWIGYKHVVYDIDHGTRQELWMDTTGGKLGGDWKRVAVHEDHFGDGFGQVSCNGWVDPTRPMVLGYRAGSESGLPNLSILLRADGIGPDGLEYRDFSIREIVPPTPEEDAWESGAAVVPPA
jgi:hypothetical protein